MNSSPTVPERKASDCGEVFPSGVQIGKTPYGLGVFAFAFIPKGTPIGRVPGKIINDPDYGSDYCISAGDGKVLEPGVPFCYINHSCDPNCQLMQYTHVEEGEELEIGELTENELNFSNDDEESYVDAEPLEEDDECFFGDGGAVEITDGETVNPGGLPQVSSDSDMVPVMDFEDDEDAEIWVESVRDIMPGEELNIDYAWPADRAVKCLCGSPKCRGWIVDPKELKLLTAG
ncbi:MAG: hypothetical protein LBN39_10100 [Planctomycetaceae bacterium]|jgi:hypothetical protein|nr:hypothetical protein [Planctomycetaceae bacterium]